MDIPFIIFITLVACLIGSIDLKVEAPEGMKYVI
ncbi:hypothetical protein QFZ77_003162 [Paenibacillus sp. V4I3]|nr:hypothetical protein [Paenibacillus sp. V4I3]MDQ0889738.1 hypothetical protein [Paenibacillus sp. V4I9]